MAATLASGGIGLPAAPTPSTVSVNPFPAPHWDKYEFISLLGRGGMGAVYKARDRRLGRIVALKFIHGDDPGLIQRFQQEARAQARLQSPNICQVHEVGFVDGKPYIAMEYIEGAALDKAARSLSLPDKVTVMRDIALAMHIAHEEGIVHRDLKPSNVMLERLGGGRLRPVVMDFGLARDTGSSVAQGLTESGAVIGTPAYMSPEQARGEARRLDRRSDVYSLGATLYDLLSGKPPFQDETVVNLLIKVMNDSPAPLRSHLPDVPEALDLIVSKCLNKEAEQRYPTALALAQDLDRFLTAGRVEARRLGYLYRLRYWSKRNRALAALALALIVGGLGSIAVGIRNHLQNLRREAEAKAEAALAQTLGQSVKDLEWLVRTAYLLPLHDTSYEKGLVRGRMAAIHRELQNAGEKGVRLGAYVLGRGHLALHEWDAAYEQLSRAEKLGYRDAGLDYALGRVLGEKYSRALDEARKSGDKSFVEKRKKELETEFLFPARSYLSRSRSQTTETPSYVEALIDFYNEHYDAALLNAHMARKQAPWLYEAAKLEGDVHMVRALAQRDRGDSATAEKSFALAVARYEDAAAVGHSDHQVHEALAEAWIRQEEMDLYRGIDPTPKMQKALTAADHAIEAAPKESYGHTKKAFAYVFAAQYLQRAGNSETATDIAQKQIIAAQIATSAHPGDAYAFDILGNGFRALAETKRNEPRQAISLLTKSHAAFEKATKINPRFPWAINDYAGSLLNQAEREIYTQKDLSIIFSRIDQLCARAISIDPQFTNAKITLLTSKINHSLWNTEHGQHQPHIIQEIESLLLELSAIIPDNILIDWNTLVHLQNLEQHNIDSIISDQFLTQRLLRIASKVQRVLPSLPDALGMVAESHIIAAYSTLAAHRDAAATISDGITVARSCLRLSPNFSDCQIFLSHLIALSSQNKKTTSAIHIEEIKKLITTSVQQNSRNAKVLNHCMLTALSMQSILPSRSNERDEYIRIGLSCANSAKVLEPSWPRALAAYGALLFAQSNQYHSYRHEYLINAHHSLAAAFAGNPNLKNRFGEAAKEVERRLAALQAGGRREGAGEGPAGRRD